MVTDEEELKDIWERGEVTWFGGLVVDEDTRTGVGVGEGEGEEVVKGSSEVVNVE